MRSGVYIGPVTLSCAIYLIGGKGEPHSPDGRGRIDRKKQELQHVVIY
jgi:hypothetical protein